MCAKYYVQGENLLAGWCGSPVTGWRLAKRPVTGRQSQPAPRTRGQQQSYEQPQRDPDLGVWSGDECLRVFSVCLRTQYTEKATVCKVNARPGR